MLVACHLIGFCWQSDGISGLKGIFSFLSVSYIIFWCFFPFLYTVGTFGIVVVFLSIVFLCLFLWQFFDIFVFLILLMNLLKFKDSRGNWCTYVLVIKKKRTYKIENKNTYNQDFDYIYPLSLCIHASQPLLWLLIYYHWYHQKLKPFLVLQGTGNYITVF